MLLEIIKVIGGCVIGLAALALFFSPIFIGKAIWGDNGIWLFPAVLLALCIWRVAAENVRNKKRP